jgi:flagellar protein FlaJ
MSEKKTKYIVPVIIAVIILVVDFIGYRGTKWFVPLIVVAVSVAWFQYWLSFFLENRKQREIEANFPEFVRNLTGSIRSGMPIGKAIIHISTSDYGVLTPYIQKMANQVEWSIPIHKILINFGNETKSKVIKRTIATVIEAEQSGGNIEDVLESITTSLIEIKKIRDERRSSSQGQLTQSYIIFIVFLGVMIVIQNFLIPYVVDMQKSAEAGLFSSSVGAGGLAGMIAKVTIDYSSISSFLNSSVMWFQSLNGIFLMLSIIQGFFSGIVIGKLSEGDLKTGLKHSLILMTLAFFVITLAQGSI